MRLHGGAILWARMISRDDLAPRRPLDEGEKIGQGRSLNTGVHVGDCFRADRLLGSGWRPVRELQGPKAAADD